jgi:hypothetical protein
VRTQQDGKSLAGAVVISEVWKSAIKVKKIKIFLLQAVEAPRVARG